MKAKKEVKNKKWRDIKIGDRFGLLTVQKKDYSRRYDRCDRLGDRRWICKCDCGKTIVLRTATLKNSSAQDCGCKNRKLMYPDMTGKMFGALKVIRPLGVRRLGAFWVCKCHLCGQEKEYSRWVLNLGKLRSCGCRRNKKNHGAMLPSGYAMRNVVLKMYKDNAKRSGSVWRLSDNQAFMLFIGKCHYCGVLPNRKIERPGKNGAFTYNGIDRKNNSRGYEVGNVVSCCTVCNFMKHSMNYEEFIRHVKQISNTIFGGRKIGKI